MRILGVDLEVRDVRDSPKSWGGGVVSASLHDAHSGQLCGNQRTAECMEGLTLQA